MFKVVLVAAILYLVVALYPQFKQGLFNLKVDYTQKVE